MVIGEWVRLKRYEVNRGSTYILKPSPVREYIPLFRRAVPQTRINNINHGSPRKYLDSMVQRSEFLRSSNCHVF